MGIDHGQERYGWESSSPSDCHAYVIPGVLELIRGNNLKILDAGCGNGYLAGRLSSLGHQVIGIDLSADGILLARHTYPAIRFEVRSVYDNLADLGTDFDLVIASEVIEHLYYPKRFLENMNNVIRRKGSLILTTPYHGWLKNTAISLLGQWDKHHTVEWEGGHIKFFSQKSIAKMLNSCGFSNIVFNNAGRIPWLWKSMVLRAVKP